MGKRLYDLQKKRLRQYESKVSFCIFFPLFSMKRCHRFTTIELFDKTLNRRMEIKK